MPYIILRNAFIFFLFEQKSSRFLISMLYISVFRFSQFHESSLFRAIHAYNLKLPFSDGIYKTSLGISSVFFIVLSVLKKISRVLFLHKNNYLFLLYLLSFLLHCWLPRAFKSIGRVDHVIQAVVWFILVFLTCNFVQYIFCFYYGHHLLLSLPYESLRDHTLR